MGGLEILTVSFYCAEGLTQRHQQLLTELIKEMRLWSVAGDLNVELDLVFFLCTGRWQAWGTWSHNEAVAQD